MKRFLTICINAIFAGTMIAIGSLVYLNCQSEIAGAFLFSIGLITVMMCRFELFTGQIGYLRRIGQVPYLLLILIMNCVGGLFVLTIPTPSAFGVWLNKLNTPLGSMFLRGIICGILIFLCVHIRKAYYIAACVAAFILCGAEHCIADMCYMIASRNISVRGFIVVLVVALGNAIGSLLISLWLQIRETQGRII